jgi:putative inorganic carbon (hco3(-)) transporter
MRNDVNGRSPSREPLRERLTFGHGAHAAVPARAMAVTPELAHEPKPFRFTHIETWDWGWGGLLIFSILLFFRPQDQISALGAMHISDLAAVVGLVAMVSVNLGRREAPIRVTPEVIGVFLLGFVILVTVPFSIWPGGSLRIFTDMYMQVALIFLLMVNTVTSPRRVERICWVIVLAFGYISARVIADYLRGINLVEGHRASGPVGGFFQNPNDLALNLAAFLPLTLMYVKRPGPWTKRLLCAGFALLMLVAIVFTKSRSGMVGTVAMLATFALVARVVTPGNMIAAVLAGMLIVPMMPQSFWDRMASITDASKDDTGSREERKLLMEQAILLFQENPITGVGAGQFQNYGPPGQAKRWRQTHNAFLQVAAEIGVFGLAAFFFLIIRAFSAALWTRKRLAWIYRPRSRKRAHADPEDGLDDHDRMFLQTHSAAMVASLVGWAVCAMFASVAFHWTLYYLLGLAVTSRDIVRNRARAYAKAKALAEEEALAA